MTLIKKDAFKRLFLCLLPCLLCLSLPAHALTTATDSACASTRYDETTKIRYIHDGDTLHLADGRKIRLIGINTPELARDKQPAEPYAAAATAALKSLFKDDKSIALLYGKDKKDHYGRVLAHTFLADGRNVQAELLKQGLAQVITLPPNTRFAACYLGVEAEARCSKTGLWQDTNIVAAQQLGISHIGFHLVEGRVESIKTDKSGVWLDLDHKLTVGIRPQNLALFDQKSLNDLLDQIVMVRGWINKSDRSTPYYMRVRHPLSIQPAAAYRCH